MTPAECQTLKQLEAITEQREFLDALINRHLREPKLPDNETKPIDLPMTPKQEIMSLVEAYAEAQVRKGFSNYTGHIDKKRADLERCIDKNLAKAEAAAFSLNGLKRFLKGKLWH